VYKRQIISPHNDENRLLCRNFPTQRSSRSSNYLVKDQAS